jgi:hypothetical protein
MSHLGLLPIEICVTKNMLYACAPSPDVAKALMDFDIEKGADVTMSPRIISARSMNSRK